MSSGKRILYDVEASSDDPELPGFLSRPQGTPVYHGFPIIPETATRGWIYGAITQYEGVTPHEEGDGYVIAPDGSRAGIAWATNTGDFYEISGPEKERWGVYGVRFPRPVSSVEDLVFNFRHILPLLKERYALVRRTKV